ncbi:hypothetical protein R3P38DRAFT_3273242 [Favolaschia claudopus]|uniref:Uncharacterized protein n=1 Tax=Favolaschia claudopus TaxID=2862362 RepID=A0AAW0B1S0_9AGAR
MMMWWGKSQCRQTPLSDQILISVDSALLRLRHHNPRRLAVVPILTASSSGGFYRDSATTARGNRTKQTIFGSDHVVRSLTALTLKPPESSNQPFRRHPAATHPHRPTTTTKTHRRVGSNVIDDAPRTPHLQPLSSFPPHHTLSSAPSRRTAPFAPPPPPFAESTLKSTRTCETPSPLPVVTASPPPPRYQHCAGISRHPDTPKPKPTKPFSPSTSNDAAAAADVVHATLVNTDAEILTSALRASPRKLALQT